MSTTLQLQTYRAARIVVLMLILPPTSFAASEKSESIDVETIPLEEALSTIEHTAPASVVSLNEGVISAQLNAQVTKVHKRVGQYASKGSSLVSLDCRETKERRTIAQANLNLAQKEIKRARSLSSSNNIAIQTLNEAETRLKQAKAESRLSAIQVERCEIKAPYSGAVTQKLISEGELASPGTALIRLIDTHNIEVSADIRIDQLNSLQTSHKPVFVTRNQSFPLTLRVATPAIDAKEHTIETRFTFSNEKATVGSPGRLQWTQQGTFLDPTYVQERKGALGYFIADGQKALFITLNDAKRGTPPRITNAPSVQVITTGRFSLKNGDDINVVETGQ